ncbi:39S ribosomal protein L30, mitochondrial [Aricia agestis]|uniref:39S ribosomal protein L30, mitochondrial n=1 Tax=Aricia agestis TaxID=91739 RepID=UPI001C204D30|nr:39S ribosomal protein L30, mitochondrial [Aricia agestis]
MNKELLKTFKTLSISCRFKGYRHPGAVIYPGGIKYYPRFPNEKEQEITNPSKLFRVERIKPVKGTPWFYTKILRHLKIDEDARVTIVKNTPDTNAKLWKIKHLIKITPITFPYGEPTAEDINHTILKENGTCLVTKTLQPHPEQVKALEAFESDPKKMDSTTIKKDSRRKWDVPFGGGF